jgi:hypothetical protein
MIGEESIRFKWIFISCASFIKEKFLGSNFIEQEFKTNENMLKFYYDRESFWIYRQRLVFLALKGLLFEKKQLLIEELEFVKMFDKNVFFG